MPAGPAAAWLAAVWLIQFNPWALAYCSAASPESNSGMKRMTRSWVALPLPLRMDTEAT